MPEPQRTDAVIDHDEVVAFGRSEVGESSGPARGRQHTEVAGPVERGEQEQATRRLREPLDPRLVQRSQLPARPGGRRRVSPSRRPPADAANSSNASGLPCASSTTPRRTRVGRCTNWRVSNSIASASGSGAMANSGNPARSKNPPTPGRVAPRSPIRLPRNRRPTNATTAPLARSSQCKSSTTMSSGPPDAACRNSASDALNTARRSGAGPEPMPSATSSATRLPVAGVAGRRTTDRRAGGGRRS